MAEPRRRRWFKRVWFGTLAIGSEFRLTKDGPVWVKRFPQKATPQGKSQPVERMRLLAWVYVEMDPATTLVTMPLSVDAQGSVNVWDTAEQRDESMTPDEVAVDLHLTAGQQATIFGAVAQAAEAKEQRMAAQKKSGGRKNKSC